MSKAATQAWKNAERTIAEDLTEAGIPAKRVSRAGNWGQKDYDVHVEKPLDNLKFDSKYTRAKPFLTNRLLREIEAKYCKKPDDEPILVTRNYKERDVCATVRLSFLIKLLKSFRDCSVPAGNYDHQRIQ